MGKKHNGSWITPKRRQQIYQRDNFQCVYCEKSIRDDRKATIDHVDPKGGHEATNLVTACGSCNNRKYQKSLTAFLNQLKIEGMDIEVIQQRIDMQTRKELPEITVALPSELELDSVLQHLSLEDNDYDDILKTVRRNMLDGDVVCWVNKKELAKQLEMPESTFFKKTASLIQYGILVVINKKPSGYYFPVMLLDTIELCREMEDKTEEKMRQAGQQGDRYITGVNESLSGTAAPHHADIDDISPLNDRESLDGDLRVYQDELSINLEDKRSTHKLTLGEVLPHVSRKHKQQLYDAALSYQKNKLTDKKIVYYHESLLNSWNIYRHYIECLMTKNKVYPEFFDHADGFKRFKKPTVNDWTEKLMKEAYKRNHYTLKNFEQQINDLCAQIMRRKTEKIKTLCHRWEYNENADVAGLYDVLSPFPYLDELTLLVRMGYIPQEYLYKDYVHSYN